MIVTYQYYNIVVIKSVYSCMKLEEDFLYNLLTNLSGATTALRSWPTSECLKSLTVSPLRLPVYYPGLNGGRLHAILPPQFGPTTPPMPL